MKKLLIISALVLSLILVILKIVVFFETSLKFNFKINHEEFNDLATSLLGQNQIQKVYFDTFFSKKWVCSPETEIAEAYCDELISFMKNHHLRYIEKPDDGSFVEFNDDFNSGLRYYPNHSEFTIHAYGPIKYVEAIDLDIKKRSQYEPGEWYYFESNNKYVP